MSSRTQPTVQQVFADTKLDIPKDMDLTDHRFSDALDEQDPLKEFRKEFILPTNRGIGATKVAQDLQDEPCTYFVGNSLGPLPKRSRELLNEEINVWATSGVNGHFSHPHGRNWMTISSQATTLMTEIVGAKESEIASMSTLTANLHLMMTSFYKPTKDKYKIICENRAFPSDEYAFTSQAKYHNLSPDDAIIRLKPRAEEHTLREEDILDVIKKEGKSVALVLFSGVQYYTGQWFPMESITKAAHEQGAICGWDLAHAVGNVPLRLHDWDVDFAVWCTYKYLNSGPGGIGGLFVHDKWQGKKLPKLAGWWGHSEATRFQMPDVFDPIPGAQGFQQSNPSALITATLLGSLQIFKEAGGLQVTRQKALQATAYLEALFKRSPNYVEGALPLSKAQFTIITPTAKDARGSQLSLLFTEESMPIVFEEMMKRGVIGDERHPGIIRYAPIPLYCSFEDCRRTAELLNEVLAGL
ncbi:Kynureninase (L-kynurenine hydrolase) [Tulasnella sp. JGI-2019a]|nr:Kynureninase (L-kynurenine hydrolase) [Tulasnella sp. JGI-2019a]